MRALLCALMAFAISGLGLIATEAQSNLTKTIFRIGIFDCSSAGFAMHLTAQHPDFRFSLDGYWPLESFLKTRTPAEQQRVITAIQKQQLFIPAQYASLLTDFPTAETLIRPLYPSANFSRMQGTPFDYANIADAPSFT